MKMNIRVGQGFDVHPFADNRKLILAGVEIPYERGLAGHSDADVLYHALCDALLGAVGQGDIGHHFPDNDAQYKNADSAWFVSQTVKLLKTLGWEVGNVDCTIMAQEPKIAPYVSKMKKTMAALLLVSEQDVNIKATTTERLGFIGRKEGIAAEAVALVICNR
ncbi:MAG: 2-C-methyl-D-erythritol 2,4-cyclodiphosphate synthase [Mariprofundus sp.]|nr:2-C-methyl-D-erythritol 2,4-cyclodiphosphate synthase [Mariprofundus sp.]